MSDIRTVHHSESAYILGQALQASGYSCLIANCSFFAMGDIARCLIIREVIVMALTAFGAAFALLIKKMVVAAGN